MNRDRRSWIVGGIVAAVLLAYPSMVGIRSLMMTRAGMATFTRLLGSANAGDLEAVRALCSSRYLAMHPVVSSREGGVVGFPRNIHRNFRVWTEGDEVRVCPGDRQGAVYRLVKEGNLWKFDGLAGLLKAGRVEPQKSDPDFPE